MEATIDEQIHDVEIWPNSNRPLPDLDPKPAEIKSLLDSGKEIGRWLEAETNQSSFGYCSGTFYSAAGGKYYLLGNGGANTIFRRPSAPDGKTGGTKMFVFEDLATLIDFCWAINPGGSWMEFDDDELAEKILN